MMPSEVSGHIRQPLLYEETVRIITEGNGRTGPESFDPNILSTFKKISRLFNDIFNDFGE